MITPEQRMGVIGLACVEASKIVRDGKTPVAKVFRLNESGTGVEGLVFNEDLLLFWEPVSDSPDLMAAYWLAQGEA